MAKKWKNLNLAGALHFVTGNVINRLKVFDREDACSSFMEICQKLKVRHECKLIAFVVMPDHFHLVVNPQDGKIQEWIGALKSLSARSLIELFPVGMFLKKQPDGSENQVWQESFKALPLWSNWMIRQKINYIRANPVKAGLVDSAKDYRWSSFRSFYFEETDPLLHIDKDWWWPGDVQKLERSLAEKEKQNMTAGASDPSEP